MTLGRRFAPAMLGPVHAGGNQGNGGRIHQMDQALELAGKTLSVRATDEARGQLAQVFEDGPEEFLRHLGRSHFVRMGKIIPRGWRRPTNAGEWTGLQAQGITHVVEPDIWPERIQASRPGPSC